MFLSFALASRLESPEMSDFSKASITDLSFASLAFFEAFGQQIARRMAGCGYCSFLFNVLLVWVVWEYEIL